MELYFGLGSNEGDRLRHLRFGIDRLSDFGLAVTAVSPTVESPALLPPDAPPDWNKPFLNLVIRGDVPDNDVDPLEWRLRIKQIEDELNRERTYRWAPRPLDIDILLWGDQVVHNDVLTIPHADLLTRAFVLTPLVHIAPDLRIPGFAQKTVFEWAQEIAPIPLWMGIVNVTPDSFTDGGKHDNQEAVTQTVDEIITHGGHIIDLGAESTRPGATPLDWESEWTRLAPALEATRDRCAKELLPPLISVDTRHWQVAERALEAGVDIINDVTALSDPTMRALAASNAADWVVMHHLTIPADPSVHLPTDQPVTEQLEAWLATRLDAWRDAGIDPARLIFDPGIGFGKDSLQALSLLQNVARLREAGLRLLVGHSRKSFMNFFSPVSKPDRDIETIGASLQLCHRGVDILRIHDVPGHARAYRSWAHVAGFD